MVKKPASSSNAKRTVVRSFRLKKETPGAIQYEEIDAKGSVIRTSDEGCLAGSVYLRKAIVGGRAPSEIRVTVEY